MKTVFRGLQNYVPLWHEMQEFTDTRDENTPDEIWFVEHPPVFTMGLNAFIGKPTLYFACKFGGGLIAIAPLHVHRL